jgi:hypothetical protein
MFNHNDAFYILACSDSPFYLIEQHTKDAAFLIRDRANNILHFKGLAAAQEHLAVRGIHSATIVYESAYDEMIGSAPEPERRPYTMASHF